MMRRRLAQLVVACAALWFACPGGRAAPPPAAAISTKIAALIDESRQLEEEGQRRVGDEEGRSALLQRAIAVLERALALDAHHIEARVALGRVLSNAELGEDSIRRSVVELYRARQDDKAGAYDCELAQNLGIVLSRIGRFEQAVAEYDRALLQLAGQPGSPVRLRSHRATILGNSAEALMAMGRLQDAIARYVQAEAIEVTDQAALHTLGLAVAYDRDGQIEKSRDALQRSLTTDPAMKLFQSDSVFFVPAGDRNYYVGLAAEAFGDREAAMSAWKAFLGELPQSRYAARARAHLDELRRTPGLTASELVKAEVVYGAILFPPERPGDAVRGGRRRTEEQVERVALSHQIELRQCYARALRKDPQLSGDLDVALVLDRHGAVVLAEAIRSGLGERLGRAAPDALAVQPARELLRCAVDTIRRWRFPPSDAEHDELALPIRFEARR